MGFKSNSIKVLTGIVILFILLNLNSYTNSYAESRQANKQNKQNNKTRTIHKTRITIHSKSSKAKQFIPTEKIKADTSVPFPVDI